MGRSVFGELRVLIVNDELFIRRLSERLLGAVGVRDITTVANRQEALALLDDGVKKFDLALIDVESPQVEGFHLINTLRQGKMGRWADLPVIVLTAEGQSQARAQAHKFGADDVLVKPMTRDDLVKSMINVLGLEKR